MISPRRRRHGSYPLASSFDSKRTVVGGIVVFILLLLVFKVPALLQSIGIGNKIQHIAAILHTEERGLVQVILEGGAPQRAEDGLRLYPGDRLKTQGSPAAVSFFDGSWARLASPTTVRIDMSERGTDHSKTTLFIEDGILWLKSSPLEVFSGSIIRTLSTSLFSASIPSNTELIATPRSVIVYQSDGQGISITVSGSKEEIIVGEGQTFILPIDPDFSMSLYAYRDPLDPRALETEFLVQSRRIYALPSLSSPEAEEELPENETEDILTLTSPQEGSIISSETVAVEGHAGALVSRIRVNGYLAQKDDRGMFSQELSLSEEEEIVIHVEALDEKGLLLDEIRRTLYRDIRPPQKPSITSPAEDGQTYRTQMREFILSGNTPKDAVGISVNEYRLQLFRPGDSTWSYLASFKLNNLSFGENIYRVTAIDASGNTSEPAEVTILIEEGEEGILEDTEKVTTEDEEAVLEEVKEDKDQESEPTLTPKDNDPLLPGTLSVTQPTPGSRHQATIDEFSIYGDTSDQTYSVSVNGYSLSLYEPGQTTWKYIASWKMGTLKRGINTYEIVARNKIGEVLDRMEYTVMYRVER